MRNTITGFDTCDLESSDMSIKRGNVYYALLPVWMLYTSWKGKKYLFSMNGQTGKFIGNLPVSMKQFWKYFIGIFAALSAVMAFVWYIL